MLTDLQVSLLQPGHVLVGNHNTMAIVTKVKGKDVTIYSLDDADTRVLGFDYLRKSAWNLVDENIPNVNKEALELLVQSTKQGTTNATDSF